MRHVPAEDCGELRLVVGIDLSVVPPARDGHVRQAPIDELLSQPFGVHMYQDAVSRLSLAAVARHRVAVVEMGMVVDAEREPPTRIEPESQMAMSVYVLNGSELAI